ncbi:MAG: M23 family metallopeptidase [Pyramidobacter sp.]|jgi:murein DD-endopeptidase MepM/ murein hydrolase activator NlpD
MVFFEKTKKHVRALARLFKKSEKLCVTAAMLLAGAASADAARMRLRVPERCPVGQPFVLEMYVNEDIDDVEVKWLKQVISLTPRKNMVRTVLGVPNDRKLAGETFPLSVSFNCGAKGRVLAERKIKAVNYDYPRQVLKVAPAMVRPPKKQLPRIAAESKAVKEALSRRSAGEPLPRTFVRPVRGIPTALFGGFREYNGVPGTGHKGLDLRAAVGTKVKAIADGTVVLTGKHYFAGGSVYVDHGSGVYSAYFHLSKILVKDGQSVKAGDLLALTGATGRVTGPHLHLGICSGGTWLDPLPLLEPSRRPKNVETLYEF